MVYATKILACRTGVIFYGVFQASGGERRVRVTRDRFGVHFLSLRASLVFAFPSPEKRKKLMPVLQTIKISYL